ncbi:MAG: hypothetical protein A2V70_12255 [Planctomycetes bacterium RBG_13_63_9]|nr:MAG: hypothetical protein A2V70_12255 [Planctomycetes bacterium RBG_13_63_9]
MAATAGPSGRRSHRRSPDDQVVEYAYDFGNRWVRKILDPDGAATGENLQSTFFLYDGPTPSANPLGSGPSQIILQFDKEGTTSAASADLNLWGTAVDQILAGEQVDCSALFLLELLRWDVAQDFLDR